MKRSTVSKSFLYLVLFCSLAVTVSILTGCQGKTGAAGSTTGTVTGTVTSATGGAALDGVTVTASSSGGTTTTDSSGNYTLTLPAGAYTLTFTRSYYTTGTASANVIIGGTTPLNVSMAEASSGKPTVTLAASGQNVGYGATVNFTATANDPNGDTVSYKWSKTVSMTGAVSTLSGTTNTNSTTMPSLASALSGSTANPTGDLGGYVSPFPQENRFGVLPITADTRGAISVSVTVNDGRGQTNSTSVTVNSAGVQPGVKAVALGIPVYLNSGGGTTTTWTVTGPSSSPTYSTATALATGRNPYFTPDAVGKYVVTTGTGSTLNIYAGNFVGVITGNTYTSKTVTEAEGMWYGWTPSSTQSSYTYTNWPVLQTDAGCGGCHDNSTAPDKFTPWKQTAHATFFARGLENITSNSNSCTTCHTVGFDQAASAANGGYDDWATTEGFNYVKGTGAWSQMTLSYPKTAKRANIQCENCHGPQDTVDPGDSSSAHGTGVSETSPAAMRVNYSSEVCAVCHASGTGHHNYSEWVASRNPDTMSSTNLGMGHSKNEQLDAFNNPLTGQPGHAQSTNSSCVRCHTAQGFALYVPQLLSGNAGTVPPASITWTKANALPQTCTACHDPHSDANENQLRIADSLPTSMAGFAVEGVGKGALCMACHNARNGIQCATAPTGTGACTGGNLDPAGKTFLHEDNDTYAPLLLDSMHDASQTEVLMGRDFFFMGNSLPMISKHAAVEDTCVGCHMTLNPQTHLSHGAPAVSSHVFYIKDADVPTLCANCHGNGTVNGEGIQAFVEQQLDVLADKIANNLLTRVNGQTIYVGSNHTQVVVGGGTTLTYYDGSFCFNGTFSGTTCSSGSNYKASLTNITTDAAGALPVFTPNDRLKKASWNWTMIDRDGSKGIHNPTLVTNVLNNTSAAMDIMTP